MRSFTRLDEAEPLLQQLKLADLSEYLQLQGWTKGAFDASEAEYHGPKDDDGTPITIVLPTSERPRDWQRRALVAVNALSVILARAPQEIVAEICSMSRDIVRVSVGGPKTSDATLALGDAIQLLISHWTLISFAACSEDDPQPYFEKARAIGKQQADRCHMGHTFRGSFGLTIESPLLPPKGAQPSVPGLPPFERRTMTRIARGLTDLGTSVSNQDLSPMLTSYTHGLNGNMCDELFTLGMRLEGHSLHYAFGWSPRFAVGPEIVDNTTLHLTERTLSYLEAASKRLRTGTDRPTITLIGKVTRLQSQVSPTISDSDEERTITVLGSTGRGPKLQVKVNLSANDYRFACDAHRDGREVSVNGTLEKEGKFWKIRGASNFTIA